jgi:hypothetical protein
MNNKIKMKKKKKRNFKATEVNMGR